MPTPNYGLKINRQVTIKGRHLYMSQMYMMTGAATLVWLNGVNFAKSAHALTHLAPMKCER